MAAYEIAGGVYDLFAKPITGAMEGGVMGAVHGTGEGGLTSLYLKCAIDERLILLICRTGLVNVVARPMKGGAVFVERLATGVSELVHHSAQPVSHDGELGTDKHSKQSATHNFTFLHHQHSTSGKELNEEEKAIEEVRRCQYFT